MKKIISLALTLLCVSAYAQTPYDALKLVQSDITGSARYMSMAGAFGALGGDVSAIKDNPAGLGIFRKSELSTTVNMLSQTSNSNWENTKTQDDLYKLGFNNFTYVLASPTWRKESNKDGLKYSNWSFSYNKLKDFNRRSYIKGTDLSSSMTDYMAYFSGNTSGSSYDFDNYPTSEYDSPWDNLDISWLSVMAAYGGLMDEYVDQATSQTAYWSSLLNVGETVSPSYILEESGALNEYSLGWSGNFSDRFFIGVNLNLQTLNYQLSTKYSEDFSGGGNMSLSNSMSTTGAGMNFNIGAIYTPIDFMRIGLAYHTPTLFALSDVGSSELDFNAYSVGYITTPTNTLDYQLLSPSQLNASLGLIVGNKGLVSAEYVLTNYTGMRFYDDNGESAEYMDENQRIKEYLNNSRTIKIGGEYKVTSNIALRAGYANESNAVVPNSVKYMLPNTTRSNTEYFIHNQTNYYTCGIGYRESSWYIDMAYMAKVIDETFYPYSASILPTDLQPQSASVITTNNNIILTFGLRF
jgi:hypothetical protein